MLLRTFSILSGLFLLICILGCGTPAPVAPVDKPPASAEKETATEPAVEDTDAAALPSEPIIEPAPESEESVVIIETAVEEKTDETQVIEAGGMELRPIADTYISCYPMGGRGTEMKHSEQGTNAGASLRLKIKRHENHPLLRFDFSAVPEGASIKSAELIVTMTEDNKPLNHVCAYSMHVDWNEGAGTWDDDGKVDLNHEGACHLGPKGLDSKWREYEESDFGHAAVGNGGNAMSLTRARDLGERRYAITIEPHVIEAAIEHGSTIALTEETGSWNEYANAFFHSREAGVNLAPVLKLTWDAERDQTPPAFEGDVTVGAGPEAGSILIDLPHAGDDGIEGNARGYIITVNGKEIPRVLIPRPRRYHRSVLLRGYEPGTINTVVVTAEDEAGNKVSQKLNVKAQAEFTGTLAAPAAGWGQVGLKPLPHKNFTLIMADGITLYDPISGNLSAQQIREGAEMQVEFHALRGEILGMQALIRLNDGIESVQDITVSLETTIPDAGIELFREHYVPLNDGWFADILPELKPGETISIPSQQNLADQAQKLAGVYIDLIIPAAVPAGTYEATIKAENADGAVSIPLTINVYDKIMPDTISFILEMNTYGHSNELDDFLAMYRLCHKHRLSYNALGYGHSSVDRRQTPQLEGKHAEASISDWTEFDKFYGPVFSGEAAKGLPRDGVPATHWYLPFHEAWPVSLAETDPNQNIWEGRVKPRDDKEAYNKWVDYMCLNLGFPEDHFSEAWRAGNRTVVKQFIEHCEEMGWTETELQVFSNHKYYFSSGSQSLWVMDEPQYGRDYRALEWLYAFYDELFKESTLNYSLRADISRPGWSGGRFDRSLDLSVGYPDWQEKIITDKIKSAGITQWWYGGGRNADADPAMYTALFIKKWRQGCSGGLPAWTFDGGGKGWEETSALRYVTYYPGTRQPVSTMRMKACRYGQQFIELLNMIAAQEGFNRWHLSDLLADEFSVKMVTISRSAEDPGYVQFEDLDAGNLETLRRKLIATVLPASE